MSALTPVAQPEVWLVVGGLVAGYAAALGAWGRRLAPAGVASTGRQRLYFALGVGLAWLVGDGLVGALATDLLTVRALQSVVLVLLAAPLLLLGLPGWLLRRLLAPPRVRRLWQRLTTPLVAFLVVHAWVVLAHLPAVLEATASSAPLRAATLLGALGVGLVLWWPVLSPLPEAPALSHGGALVYLAGHALLPAVPASLLTFATTHHVAGYATSAAALGVTPLLDQQLAGALVKLAGTALLTVACAALVARWSHEEETGAPDLRVWRDLANAIPTGGPEPRSPQPRLEGHRRS